jgi:hypothetical protein
MVRWIGVLALVACSAPKGPIGMPEDGATEIVFENHLPGGFQVSSVKVVIDGEEVQTDAAATLYRAHLAQGDHTLSLVVDVRVPCGLAAEPYEKLTAQLGRAFEVGPAGGLVHVDAFAQSAWLHPSERVHMLVSLRGLREGRWLYGRSKEARAACGRLGRVEKSRCVVQQLVERSRAKRDIAGLLCQKSRLEAIDDIVAELDRSDRRSEEPNASRAPEDVARVERLEREAEFCVAEDPGWMGQQEVTSDRSACARYDEP